MKPQKCFLKEVVKNLFIKFSIENCQSFQILFQKHKI